MSRHILFKVFRIQTHTGKKKIFFILDITHYIIFTLNKTQMKGHIYFIHVCWLMYVSMHVVLYTTLNTHTRLNDSSISIVYIYIYV